MNVKAQKKSKKRLILQSIICVLLILAGFCVGLLTGNLNFGQEKEEKEQTTTNIIAANTKISILGDSISTCEGVSNNGEANRTTADNAVYYPMVGHPVSQSETYWGRIIEKHGMNLIVNNSASGSLVTEDVNKNKLSGITRCEQLHNNAGTNPDIIAVYMGTNDLTKGKSVEAFAEGYATMLSKITTKYSAADVFCFTLLPSTINAGKDTELNQYNEQIRTIAATYGCTVVDIAISSGITRDNTIIFMDGSHPHANGHALLANTFEESLMLKYATFK